MYLEIDIIDDIVLGFIVFDLRRVHNIRQFADLANNRRERIVFHLSLQIELFPLMIIFFQCVAELRVVFMELYFFIRIHIEDIEFIGLQAYFI